MQSRLKRDFNGQLVVGLAVGFNSLSVVGLTIVLLAPLSAFH